MSSESLISALYVFALAAFLATRGDFTCAAVTAHASDVSDKCNLRNLARRLNRDCRSALQHCQYDPGIHRRRLLHYERSRRVCDYRSDASDV